MASPQHCMSMVWMCGCCMGCTTTMALFQLLEDVTCTPGWYIVWMRLTWPSARLRQTAKSHKGFSLISNQWTSLHVSLKIIMALLVGLTGGRRATL